MKPDEPKDSDAIAALEDFSFDSDVNLVPVEWDPID